MHSRVDGVRCDSRAKSKIVAEKEHKPLENNGSTLVILLAQTLGTFFFDGKKIAMFLVRSVMFAQSNEIDRRFTRTRRWKRVNYKKARVPFTPATRPKCVRCETVGFETRPIYAPLFDFCFHRNPPKRK